MPSKMEANRMYQKQTTPLYHANSIILLQKVSKKVVSVESKTNANVDLRFEPHPFGVVVTSRIIFRPRTFRFGALPLQGSGIISQKRGSGSVNRCSKVQWTRKGVAFPADAVPPFRVKSARTRQQVTQKSRWESRNGSVDVHIVVVLNS